MRYNDLPSQHVSNRGIDVREDRSTGYIFGAGAVYGDINSREVVLGIDEGRKVSLVVTAEISNSDLAYAGKALFRCFEIQSKEILLRSTPLGPVCRHNAHLSSSKCGG